MNNPQQKKEKKPFPLFLKVFLILVSAIAILAIFTFLFYKILGPGQQTIIIEEAEVILEEEEEEELEDFELIECFGKYQEVALNYTPSIPAYKVLDDLSNIENIEDFILNERAAELLAQNGFFIKESYNNEFFPLYESNRYNHIPSFITTDSILHNYHLIFDRLLSQLEEQTLSNELLSLSDAMIKGSLSQYRALNGTSWEESANRNSAFFTLGYYLISQKDKAINLPDSASEAVDEELKLIQNQRGVFVSPIMALGQGENKNLLMEDYSQYIPRGHYTKSEQLKSYFQSMMWYGRLSFRLNNKEELKSAVLITMLLQEDKNRESWEKIFTPINFFVGKTDDIDYYDLKELLDHIYGESLSIEELVTNDKKFDQLFAEAKKIQAPAINSIPIPDATFGVDREEAITAFRFLGQRYTVDADIFQSLIYPAVGDKANTCEHYSPVKTNCLSGARCLPQGLDIPAALNSKLANKLIKDLGESNYACYNDNLREMQSYLSGLGQSTWTQNLYWGWLFQLQPLLKEKTAGYPSFMLSDAWERKSLQTFLSSWSQLKHDTILYAKQVYAELGGGLPNVKDDRGYVEPEPEVYARLVSLLRMTRQGLDSRQILSPSMSSNLEKLEQLALALKNISEKELNNEKLSEEDYELIRSYGGQLEHLWIEINKDEPQFAELDQRNFLDQNPASLIADVATDPNGVVLEVGTGKINEIYVVVPIDGELRLTRGGVFSYYEFPWPINDRLNNEAWREMLNTEKPDQADWIEEISVKSHEASLN